MPALRQNRTQPSPELANEPAPKPLVGFQQTPHTSSCSCSVDTHARCETSQILIVRSEELSGCHGISAAARRDRVGNRYPLIAALPSVAMEALKTHELWPLRDATAPDPGFPPAEVRTSWRTSRLSSDAESRSYTEKGLSQPAGSTWRVENVLVNLETTQVPGRSSHDSKR